MKAWVALLFLLTFFSSCRFFGGKRVRGDGNIVNVQRNVGSFNSIDAGGAMEVRVKQGNASSVSVETDENIQEYIEVVTDGNTLEIRSKRGYNLKPSDEIVVYVTAPRYKTLDVSGASKLLGEGTISGEELELGASGASEIRLQVAVSELQAELSGASTLQLQGSATRFFTEASGASKVRCIELTTDETKLDVSGSTKAEVTASKQLTIEASGASDVEYRGSPSISQNSSGASSVRKVS